MSDVMSQPELLSDEELALVESGLVAAVSRPDASRFTGKIIERQTEMVDAILRATAEGQSRRAIARAFGVGRSTVDGVIERAVAAGKLGPHKERAIAAGWRIVRKSQELIEEWIDTDQVKPGHMAALSVAMGVNSDKIGLWSGEAGLVIEHRHTVDMDRFRERLEQVREQMQAGRAVTPAVTSGASGGKVVDVQEVAQ